MKNPCNSKDFFILIYQEVRYIQNRNWTLKGKIKFNIENLDNLEKYLIKYPDYTGIKAKRLVKEKNK